MIYRIPECNLVQELKNVGVNPASIEIFMNKAAILPLKILKVRTPAANIIKQEMLACGGDCAVHACCITCSREHSDILLLGTLKHYRHILGKLGQMNYFGIAQISMRLSHFLSRQETVTELADGRKLVYDRVAVMGIINVTPDSFYSDSRATQISAVLSQAGKMLEDGAQILDIGGESTRPGAAAVTEEEEKARIVPVVRELRKQYPQAILSVDTYNASTAEEAIFCGADIINDISAATADPTMEEVVLRNRVPIIIMHIGAEISNMHTVANYNNVVEEVAEYLFDRAAKLESMGIGREKVIIDPGIGFAKNVGHNLKLMQGLSQLAGNGYPVLLAASRKSTIGSVLGGLPSDERLYGTIATSCQAVYSGANLIRVHDVKENVQAVRMLEAVLKCQ